MLNCWLFIYRDCSFYNIETDVIGQTPFIVFTWDLGGQSNPLLIDLGNATWEVCIIKLDILKLCWIYRRINYCMDNFLM